MKKLVEIEQATGTTPAALLDAPVAVGLEKELVLAYNFLASRRSIGFTPNPIPLSEIESYVKIFGTPSMPVDVFVELLGTMDVEYLTKLHGTHKSSGNC